MRVVGYCRETSERDVLKAKSHYHQAKVDGVIYTLNDDAYVKICKPALILAKHQPPSLSSILICILSHGHRRPWP
ncbi:hypothetical protein RIF29_09302 [Crotalaria pallida]|uniref:Uncharacterized protein n=1 Tax=Crotalaria pallida TaxID=3830 RepID=A0AAN9FY18_CROPI